RLGNGLSLFPDRARVHGAAILGQKAMGVSAVRTRKTRPRWPRHALLSATGLLMLLPFLWMIVTSLQSPEALTAYPPQLVPSPPRFSNYSEVFSSLPIGTFFFNSVKISLLGTLGELIAASLAAFAFARMEFRGKKWLFAIVISTMMVPFQVTMVPVYIIMHYLGWLDSQASLIVPH